LAAWNLPSRAEAPHVEPKLMTPPVAKGEVPEPHDYRTDGYRMPVPRTLKGATVIDADAAEKLIKNNAAVFIDVYPRAPKPPNLPAGTIWRDPPHASIPGAHWLPNVGYGVLSPDFESYFRTRLEKLTGNDKAKPIVVFCLKDCWMSWNAAKRALSWGYTSVTWFPEGTDGWQDIGNDLTPASPVP
jgi:PQQ-dependent catabolism-associated CXXCW motif protein